MSFTKTLAVAAVVALTATASSASTYALGDIGGGVSASNTLGGAVFDYYTLHFGTGGTYLNFDTLGSNALSGIDTEIGLYDSYGSLVAENDDHVIGGSYTLDSALNFSGPPASGSYTLVVGSWSTNWTNDIDDLAWSGFSSGAYNLNISTDISAVPLPAGGLLLISGLFGIAVARRKKKAV